MSDVTTVSLLDGYFKYMFGGGSINVIPQYTKLLKMIPFESAKALGRKYIFPVIVSDEQGVTFANDGSAFTLNGGISMSTQEAEVEGVEIVLQGLISYKAAASAKTDKQAFANILTQKVERMAASHARIAEYQMLYGGSGARVTAATGVNATTTVIDISAATWSAGFWAGSKNMTLQFYANNDSTLISSGADSVFSVSSVDYTTRKVTLTGTATGITALNGATFTGGGLYLYRNGAKGKEMSGLDKICTNTGSLFGIDAALYDLWKANNIATSGALTFAKVKEAVTASVQRGFMGDVTVLLPPKQFDIITTDQSALRRYSDKGKKGENGFTEFDFHGTNGKMNLEVHPMLRDGDIFIIPNEVPLKRVGSTDITFQRPNEGGKFFRQLDGRAGYEFQSYSDFAIVPEKPATLTKLSGFTP